VDSGVAIERERKYHHEAHEEHEGKNVFRIRHLLKIHEAQLLTYMKLANVRIASHQLQRSDAQEGDQKICFLIS
jgi:hypothetical protein